MNEKIEYQKGILPNLLSGFYELVELKNKDESHRAIFSDLKREFEKLISEKNDAVRRGRVEELHFLQYTIEADVKDNKVWKEGSQYFEIILDKIERRLKELQGVEKHE